MLDYVSGVMDALDGSHGPGFTYLPIVYQDDCQVVLGEFHHVTSEETKYEVVLTFLESNSVERSRLPNKRLERPGITASVDVESPSAGRSAARRYADSVSTDAKG